jgi:hypothetical protein
MHANIWLLVPHVIMNIVRRFGSGGECATPVFYAIPRLGGFAYASGTMTSNMVIGQSFASGLYSRTASSWYILRVGGSEDVVSGSASSWSTNSGLTRESFLPPGSAGACWIRASGAGTSSFAAGTSTCSSRVTSDALRAACGSTPPSVAVVDKSSSVFNLVRPRSRKGVVSAHTYWSNH